jgi:hypothetical protein
MSRPAPDTAVREVCWACGEFLHLHRPAAYGKGERDRVWCAHCGAWTVPGTGSAAGIHAMDRNGQLAGGEPNRKESIVIGVPDKRGPDGLAVEAVRKVIRWARMGMK